MLKHFRLVFCCVLVATAALAQGASDAARQFESLLQGIHQARQKEDVKAALSLSLQLAKLLNGSASATEQLALVSAEMNDREHALEYLRDFAAMGQSDDGLASRPQFKSLSALPEFKKILSDMRANESRIQTAAPAMHFQDANLLTEDLDYDAATRTFLATSVLEQKIVRLAANGAQTDFFKSPDGWPMLAIKIDSRRGIVWATEVALKGFAAAPSKDWGNSRLFCLRLNDARVIRKIDAAGKSLGDMGLMPNSDVIVSDNNGAVYRVRANSENPSLERVDDGQFISPQTPTAAPDGRRIFVPDYARGIALLDLNTKQAQWLDSGHQHALEGIDGLYFASGGLLATQNGTSPERVVFFRLDLGMQKVISESVLERATPTLGDPTHGVVVQNAFYYIANSGWSDLDDAGHVKPGASLTPALLMQSHWQAH
ncbi:MAG TPA: hypothetical protein VE077_00970 [Candidatus Methylomirabilis sp.]|nr:hypothetical protein [Candidatus Methylomirabilis sp.]